MNYFLIYYNENTKVYVLQNTKILNCYYNKLNLIKYKKI